jgi:hypothetical protein
MPKSRKWLYVRLAIVGLFVASAPSLSRSVLDDLSPLLLIFVFGYSYLSSVFSLRCLHRRRSRFQNWERPTWFSNPFSGAAHFFHMVSYCFMGIGLLSTILTATDGRNVVLPATPAIIGLGMFLGIRRFYQRLDARSSIGGAGGSSS